MRNYSFDVPSPCVLQVSFDSGASEPISEEVMEVTRARCELKLKLALEVSLQGLTPSEESTLEQFHEWFSRCRANSDWGPYKRGTGPVPLAPNKNTVFVYCNMNTGINLVFIPCEGLNGLLIGGGVI